MIKPLHLMTPEEKAELMKRLRKDAEGEEFFTGVLGNKNSFFIAKPLRKRKTLATGQAKTSRARSRTSKKVLSGAH